MFPLSGRSTIQIAPEALNHIIHTPSMYNTELVASFHSFIYCYTTTEMQFSIGRERITRRAPNLYNFPGRTELTNSLGKQQLEPWT